MNLHKYYTAINPPVDAGPNTQADGKRLIFRQTDSLVLHLPLWLMEILMESTSFFKSEVHRMKKKTGREVASNTAFTGNLQTADILGCHL
jgi:hypothetical protein